MNLFIAQKKDYNQFNLFQQIVGILIITFPFCIIIGTAFVEINANLIALYGLLNFIILKKYKNNKIIIFLLFIYFFSNFSSFLSPNNFDAFSRSLFLFRYPLFFFGLILFLNNNDKYLHYTLISITVAVIFVYFDDLFQLITGEDIFNFKKQQHRLSGPFNDELIPGIFLFRFGLISIITIISLVKIKNNFFNLLLSMSLILGVVITGEKTSSVMIFLSISLFYFINYGFKKIYLIFIILIVFISSLVVIINTNEIYKERIWGETKRTLGIFNEDRSFIDSEHGVMLFTAYKIWENNKLFGVGLKNYRHLCKDDKYAEINSLVVDNRCSTHPHNFYLEILSELGLIGIFLYVSLFIFILFKIFQNYKKEKNIITLSIFCTLSVILFPFLFTNSFFTNFNLLWIVFLLSIGLVKFKSENEK